MKSHLFLITLFSGLIFCKAQSTTNPPPTLVRNSQILTKALPVQTKVFVHNLWNHAATNEFDEQNILRGYLRRDGVNLSAPSAIFFNEREKVVRVRSTEPNIKKVAASLAKLNSNE